MVETGSRATRAFRDATIVRQVCLSSIILLSIIAFFDNDCDLAKRSFTRFKGQHLGESTEELKKILDERRVDEILLFLQKSQADRHVSFQVVFQSSELYFYTQSV